MIDIRKEFQKIMKGWGSNVYLQRRVYAHRNDIPEEDKEKTHFFSPKLEKYTVRYTYAGRLTSLTNMAEERIEGIVRTVDRVYFFPYDSHPTEGDRIYQPDVRYPKRFETYLVDYALALRGVKGRIEYYEVGVTRETPE